MNLSLTPSSGVELTLGLHLELVSSLVVGPVNPISFKHGWELGDLCCIGSGSIDWSVSRLKSTPCRPVCMLLHQSLRP